MARAIGFAALAGVFVLATWSLVTAQALLLWELPGGLPFGNLLTGAGKAALGGCAVLLARPGGLLHRLSMLALAAGLLWLPVSIAMAGNLQLNFAGGNGTAWWYYTLATGGLCLLAFGLALLAGLYRLVTMRRRSR